MGTTTFFLKNNDLGKPLNKMGKEELEKLNNLSPYSEKPYYSGWQVPLELHNGNVYALVFWKGKLMKIDDAPKVLNRKYYNKYRGKEVNEYEWTVLKKYISAEIQRLDKEFKKSLRNTTTSIKVGRVMKNKDFNDLLTSIDQARKIHSGKLKSARVFKFHPIIVKRIRKRLHASQLTFAHMIGVSVDTLQNWEQGRRKPEGPALALLKVAEANPETVMEALHA